MKSLYTLIFLFIGSLVMAQYGEIQGTITDGETHESLPFAAVIAKLNGIQKAGTTSDLYGSYTLKPLTPGEYTIEAQFTGYASKLIKKIIVSANKITEVNIELAPGIEIDAIEIETWLKPLFEKDQTISQQTLTGDEIAKIPTRNINDLVGKTAGVVQRDEGEGFNIRGGRENANDVYIDGVKVRGSNALPQGAIQEITTITGGIPAQYGDATGGIVSITTRGPSGKFNGGFEAVTSQYLDPYGYNLFGSNISGPIAKTNRGTEFERPLAGYFLSAEYRYRKDPDPSSLGMYKVKDNILDSLEKMPLQPALAGVGFDRRAEFLTLDDLEKIDAKQNVQRHDVAGTGKISIAPTKNTDILLGGTYNYQRYNDFIYSYSLFNPENNPQYTYNLYRIFGRFTQKFGNDLDDVDEEKTSMLQNAYYSVQADYTSVKRLIEDESHRSNIFDYGYVGKFTTHVADAYVLGTDTISGYSGFILASKDVDTLIEFDAGAQNPLMANYTQVIYDNAINPPQTLNDVLLAGGLRNGQRPEFVYSLWFNTGRQFNFYGYDIDNDQLSLSVDGSVDIGLPGMKGKEQKNKHALKFGFVYEQRTDRYGGINPLSIWVLADQLANSHIKELDLSNPKPVFDANGVFQDTVNYDRLYNPDDQTFFDKQLRKSLGLAENSLDLIDIDALDPSQFTIDMFSADELFESGSGTIFYYGYDYKGNRLSSQPAFNDFFTEKDDDGNYTRPIGAYQPIYTAGYIQDKFNFKDIIFNVGLRVDRFDANHSVLRDKYSLYKILTAEEVDGKFNEENGNHPDNIENNYAVYVNDFNDPSPKILGYRDGDTWYDVNGTVLNDPSLIAEGSKTGTITPYLDPNNVNKIKDEDFDPTTSFTDYEPSVSIMPRISFSFPISDEANFFAHYDVYTQRPQTGRTNLSSPFYYYFLEENSTGSIPNPAMGTERTVEYEAGFKQKLTIRSALAISGFYREMRDMIQITRINFAYPIDYTTFDNIDFGNVKGMELTYDLRRSRNVQLIANYTLSFADGTGSSETTQSGIIGSDQPNLRTVFPLSFDRRHMISVLFDYRYTHGDDYTGPVWFNKNIFEDAGLNVTFDATSGIPYSGKQFVTQGAAFGVQQQASLKGTVNGARLPWTYRMNAQIDKNFIIKTGDKDAGPQKRYFLNVYVTVLNLLNTQNILNVYGYTGSPDDDGWLSSAKGQTTIEQQLDPNSYIDLYTIKVNNPGFYSRPRRIRIGAIFNF